MNDDEIHLTKLCHEKSIEYMEGLMKRLGVNQFDRAIELGCGDGMFTRDHLIKKYDAVDVLDLCNIAIKKVKLLKKKNPKICYVDKGKMQDYKWRFLYNGIFLRWSIGYLDD